MRYSSRLRAASERSAEARTFYARPSCRSYAFPAPTCYGARSGWDELARNLFRSRFAAAEQRVAGRLVAIAAKSQKALRPRHMRFERPDGRTAQPGKIDQPASSPPW